MRFLILGRSVAKKKKHKKNWKRSLELGGPVSQRNIRGAWKQQDVVIKSTWRQWRKEKIDVVVKLKREQPKKDEPPKLYGKKLPMFWIKLHLFEIMCHCLLHNVFFF